MLGSQGDVVRHLRAMPHREVAAAIRTARASTVPLAVRLEFELQVLPAIRWGEVRWAQWTQNDRDGTSGACARASRLSHPGRKGSAAGLVVPAGR